VDRDRLRADLIRDEGKKLLAYADSLGNWTIGVGHLLGKRMRMSEITTTECMALLDADITAAIALVFEVCPDANMLSAIDPEGDEVRQRALVNMAFNRGGHMRTSTAIVPAINAAIKNGEWKLVADAIRLSPWAAIVGKRAERLAYMFETGKDPA
jgi:GH24 family phage-related lysozyme (muramidase)